MAERVDSKEKINLDGKLIILIGPEGVGKSVQGLRLSEKSGLPYITTGGIIKDLAKNDNGELGDACRDMVEKKTYLASDLLLRIIQKRFKEKDVQNGLILDGGLRKIEETKDFPQMLEGTGLNLSLYIVHLDVPREVAIKRLQERGRTDDTPEGIAERHKNYYSGLSERLSIIKNTPGWNYIQIDGSKSKEEVYEDILKNLYNSQNS